MQPGDILSYLQMCSQEGVNLQRGMNYHLRGGLSVILMSLRPRAPYADRIEDNGRVLIYEGHDLPRQRDSDPKMLDQPMMNPNHTLTQNGLFYQAAMSHKQKGGQPEHVRVYEKVRPGIWVYNGLFKLVDAWQEKDNSRKVFKFRLQMLDDSEDSVTTQEDIDHTRLIPASVKLQVWQRDKGRCVICGSSDNLHFDHIIPYSRGGSSLVAANIRLLCARHNLAKRDRIEYA
ncbi:MAG: HNH endonuclease [Chloroflexi bacterium]|nr:HNH endonuclease [Chloroflexota bacterium]